MQGDRIEPAVPRVVKNFRLSHVMLFVLAREINILCFVSLLDRQVVQYVLLGCMCYELVIVSLISTNQCLHERSYLLTVCIWPPHCYNGASNMSDCNQW